MKITDLPDCPKWLKEAATDNADVEWDSPVRLYIIWLGGEWHGGEWLGGEWLGGVWRGGVWRGGVWLGGEWLGGEWHGGEWLGGEQACRSAYIPRICQDGTIRVGCKKKTAQEWVRWLKGEEEYNTKRGTLEFRMIRAHILATIAYQKAMKDK